MTTAVRFDSYNPDWMTRPFERTSEGFLNGRAIVTNVGVFPYQQADGSVHYELRLPEEVFARDSLESLKLKPITNSHPADAVTPENVKVLSCGTTGSNPSSTTQIRDYEGYTPSEKITDGYHLAIDLTIQEETAINDVLEGKRALSCGYRCDLEPASEGAVWCGVRYDFIQRNIRYNHVAIVDTARAGDMAKIKLDSADAIMVSQSQQGATIMADMKKITLDGVDFQAEKEVIVAYTQMKQHNDQLEKDLEAAKKSVSTIEAERDNHRDRAEKLEAEVKKLKSDSESGAGVDAQVAAKLQLISAAQKAQVEITTTMDDNAVRKAVILSVFPKANLDSKDDAYISARFDAAVEELDELSADDAHTRARTTPIPASNRGDGVSQSADAARKAMIARLQQDSRGSE